MFGELEQSSQCPITPRCLILPKFIKKTLPGFTPSSKRSTRNDRDFQERHKRMRLSGLAEEFKKIPGITGSPVLCARLLDTVHSWQAREQKKQFSKCETLTTLPEGCSLEAESGSGSWGDLVPLKPGLNFIVMTKEKHTVGRIDADVFLSHPMVSALHCRVGRGTGGVVYLEDLKSKHGTFLNGKRLKPFQPTLLKPMDIISLCRAWTPGQPSGNSIVAYMFQRPTKGPVVSPLKLYDSSEQIFKTKYRLGKLLGKGATGQVFEAVEVISGHRFAVKIMETQVLAKQIGSQKPSRLMREANLLKKMNHPNITRYVDFFSTTMHHYLVTECVGGGDLLDYVLARGSVSEQEATIILRQILKAVRHMHSRNVCHRDLKPENILVAEGHRMLVKLADFGIAAPISPQRLHTFCGTAHYGAPEVLACRRGRQAGSYGKAADMWSIGVILYVLLCGEPPFDGDEAPEVFKSVEQGIFDTESENWVALSVHAKDFICRLLSQAPELRPTVIEALQHPFMKPAPVSSKAVPTCNSVSPLVQTQSHCP